MDEILLRRIGANELRTIDVMRGYVEAQKEYAAVGQDGNPHGIYAKLIRSTPRKHDGLYWEIAAGQPQSPAGPLLAAAAADGYARKRGATGPSPYHGYFYRTLDSQGPAATGGARNYVVGGKLKAGFALLAYPDAYGASGVMTFMVNQDGVVWQRDLGEKTAELVAAIHQFNPDSSWTPIPAETDSASARP
ncbi:MAG TPA: DUF2950 family protein [Gemmatimonadales bacterium]|nr:DUF2950 family protein [Gemmatimonadales bacterium]